MNLFEFYVCVITEKHTQFLQAHPPKITVKINRQTNAYFLVVSRLSIFSLDSIELLKHASRLVHPFLSETLLQINYQTAEF